MRNLGLSCCLFLISLNTLAQNFTGVGGHIQDYSGTYNRQEYLCEIYDLPAKLDSSFGLEKALISIHHGRISDLKISLQAPDGSNIWLTNRNGRDSGKNYANTNFSMYALKYIHEGIAPFAGEYIPDGRMEYLNNGQNPNGYWKLIVEDLKNEFAGTLDSFVLTFSNQPARIKLIKRCSFQNPELCVCANDVLNGEMLPDLVMLPSFTKNQIQEYAWNDINYPGQLRFAASIANIGLGPMEIKGSGKWYCGSKEVSGSIKCADGQNSRQLVLQKLFYKKENSIQHREVHAGSMYLDDHAGHNHYHVDDWVAFRLIRISPSKKKKIISKGRKVSYCLFSSGLCDNSDQVCIVDKKHYGENMPNYGLGDYSSCNTEKQGITVGGYDTYGLLYEGQYLQLPKNLKTGKYLLEIEIDPDHTYKESNIKNNLLSMPIIISKQQR